MTEVILGLGSNLGSSKEILTQALNQIENLNEVLFLKSSPFFQTAPISSIAQNDFLNLVCLVETTCSNPHLFLKQLQKIEKNLGKVPKPKEAPRRIDIDILLYGTSFIQSDDLIIPHPKMLERAFVLEPLSYLKKEILHPRTKTHFQKIQLKPLLSQINKDQKQFVKELF